MLQIGGKMKFKNLKVVIFSEDKQYGFDCEFKNGLNIIRGDNSSGKSTLVNSLMYSVGMEEIIGAKGANSLPYALKTYFELNSTKIEILESFVFVEVENKDGVVKTFKRAVKSEEKNTKLIEVIHGDYLSNYEDKDYLTTYTFVHDPGSAQDPELGFYAFFEKFIGFELPFVSNNNGGETKLYLQAIFSSLFIEQKRGWTNYIANTPYYPISSIKEKIISFILDLDRFRNEKKLEELISERSNITNEWSEIAAEIKVLLNTNSLLIKGVANKPVVGFDEKLVLLGQEDEEGFISIKELISKLVDKVRDYEEKENIITGSFDPEILEKIDETRNDISSLMLQHKINGDEIRISESKKQQYTSTLDNVVKDLKRNKLAKKVNEFGVKYELRTAKGQCVVCMQTIDDTLSPPENLAMPMTIEENIRHLENQKSMVESILNGLDVEVNRLKANAFKIKQEIVEKKSELVSYNKDVKTLSTINESDIRIKVAIENRYAAYTSINNKIEELIPVLTGLSEEYAICLSGINKLNKFSVSYQDEAKIIMFEKIFKQLASKFEYRSAQIEEISINNSTLIPYLKGLELREYSTDIKSDSSASDFVRLIWAYLITSFKVSNMKNGNHPGILLFDEPAQHSMGLYSVNSMLAELSKTECLQSIVAASFDQSDAAFNESTEGVAFHLIRLPNKLIGPVFN